MEKQTKANAEQRRKFLDVLKILKPDDQQYAIENVTPKDWLNEAKNEIGRIRKMVNKE